jgi:hypothetical protein
MLKAPKGADGVAMRRNLALLGRLADAVDGEG